MAARPSEEHSGPSAKLPAPARRTKFFSDGRWRRANVYTRDADARPKMPGPAIIVEPHQTVVVEQGWRAESTAPISAAAAEQKRARAKAIGTGADPVMLEVFNNLFMSIAEQMGVALQNTAYSVNIKERLDFSCALFDRNGSLIANAPHMPVHLGSMDRAVETIIRANQGKMRPGDVYVLNAPYNGGTHLPDVTVIMPVFDGRKILFCVAARGHQADIGGITPGSMPPNATTIEQEGVLIDNFKLVEPAVSARRNCGRCSPAADIRRATRRRTSPTSRRRSPPTKRARRSCAAWCAISRCRWSGLYAACPGQRRRKVRRVIDRLHDGRLPSRWMRARSSRCGSRRQEAAQGDDRIHRHQPAAAVNFNAPEPVTRAAVLYVFRVMVEDDIPMNAGCLRPIGIVIPKARCCRRSFRPPWWPAMSRPRRR